MGDCVRVWGWGSVIDYILPGVPFHIKIISTKNINYPISELALSSTLHRISVHVLTNIIYAFFQFRKVQVENS